MTRIACLTLTLIGLGASTADAQITNYNSRDAFVSATAAVAQGDFPAVGTTTGGIVFGDLAVIHAAPTVDLIVSDWTPLFAGDDMGFSGTENFDVTILGEPALSFGFEMVEPSTPGPLGCNFPTCIDSTFRLALYDGATFLGATVFNANDDVASFVGVQSAVPFDRVELRELTDDIGNEYFGDFLVGRCQTSVTYGPATAGTGGFEPLLPAPYPTAQLGQTAALVGSNMLGGAPVLLAVGAEPQQLTVKGIELLVVPNLYLPITTNGTPGVPGSGGFELPLLVPSDPAFVDLVIYLQLIVLDDGGPAAGYASSRGLELRFCP